MKPYRLPNAYRPQAASRGLVRPLTVSAALAATAVYGDLLKRVLPGTVALMALYAIEALILAVMVTSGRRKIHYPTPTVSILSRALIVTYCVQFCTGFDVDLQHALMMLIYMSLPLAFIVVIPKFYPDFDLRALALFTTIFMVPLHAVGLVQQFVDTSFMVSTAYSETGGVIARNFLEGTGSFNRLPSLFASADRYAGVSAMQVLLSFLLLSGARSRRRSSMLLLVFALLSGASGMMLAGARSRIVILGIALLIGGIALLVKVLKGRLSSHGRTILARASLTACLLLVGALSFEQVRARVAELPVFSMLAQSVEKGDAQGRFQQGIDISMMPHDVSFFGEGLGTSTQGRPGEFGIRALWIEGGFFWTTIMLILHAGVLLLIGASAVRATLAGDAVESMQLTAAGLTWLFGLLAGLSGSFEVSLALLLFPMIAVVEMAYSRNTAGRPRQHPWGSQGRGMR